MRFQLLAAMPASTVQDWLDHELEVRGIDAVVYTRYILSILQQDSYELEPTEADPFPMIVGKKELASAKLKGKGKQRLAKIPKIQDWDKLKKSAAVECLLSVSEQKCGIEELVDELYSRLKSIQCEGILAQKQLEMKALTNCDEKLPTEDLVNSSPREQAEKYYAAFPALGGSEANEKDKSTEEQNRGAATQSAWSGKKLTIGAAVEKPPEEDSCVIIVPLVEEEGPKDLPESVPSRQPKRSLDGKLPPPFIVPKTPSYWKRKLAEEARRSEEESLEGSADNKDPEPGTLFSVWDDSLDARDGLRYNDLVASIWQADEKPRNPASPAFPQEDRDEGVLAAGDRIWQCDGLDKFIKGGVYGFPKGDSKEDVPEERALWDPPSPGSSTHMGFERCVKVWDGLDSDWPTTEKRPLWDEYGLTWEHGGFGVLDEPLPVKVCSLPFHNDESRFVEVVPKRVLGPQQPTSTSSSSSSLSLCLSPSPSAAADPDLDEASSDAEENLLISPRTHFRPIRRNSRDAESSSGDEPAAGDAALLPQPITDLFTRDEEGDGSSPHRYMVYKGHTSSDHFQPKFKLRSNLDKFCQTDEWDLDLDPCHEADVLREEMARDEEELFEVIRNVRDLDLDLEQEESDGWRFRGFRFGRFKGEGPQLRSPEESIVASDRADDECSGPNAAFHFQTEDHDDTLGPSSASHLPTVCSNKVMYSWDLEEEWKNTGEPFDVQVPKRQSSKQKVPPQRRPCSFFMEGNCRRTDCKFSHDLASITCRFWEEGSCFKGMTCPFLHGYPRFPSPSAEVTRSGEVRLASEDEFPALTKHMPKKTREPGTSLGPKRKKRVCTPIPRQPSPFEDKASRFLLGEASGLH